MSETDTSSTKCSCDCQAQQANTTNPWECVFNYYKQYGQMPSCCPPPHPFPPCPPYPPPFPPWPPFPPPPPPPPPPVPPIPGNICKDCTLGKCYTTEGKIDTECLVLDLDTFTVGTVDSVTDFKEYRLNKILFKPLQGKQFQMGSPSTEIGRYSQINKHLDFEPRHTETVSDFAIAVFPTTQKQYEKVTGEKHESGCCCRNFNLPCRAKDMVSWNDVSAFIDTVNGKLAANNSEYRVDFPKDAEWEFACRGGSDTPWCDSSITPNIVDPKDEYSLSNTRTAAGLEKYAAYLEGSNNATQVMNDPKRFPPVGTKKANAYNLYDMHGNVWEWCKEDWYIEKDGQKYLDEEGIANKLKVVRGGGYWFNADDCRSANRHGYVPTHRNHGFGFRLVLRKVK